jgi:transposase InsO family protein
VPRDWPDVFKSAFATAVALAHRIAVEARALGENSPQQRLRLQAALATAHTEIALLRRELALKDARWSRVPPAKRPHYAPRERLAVLLLRADRGWSAAETARRFFVTVATIASWDRRLDEGGEDALVQSSQPVNRYADFVRAVVEHLKETIPDVGVKRIADFVARAGIHLSRSTVRRVLRERVAPPPRPAAPPDPPRSAGRTVKATYPDHVWGVDLTLVPIFRGLRVPWKPLAELPVWPFAYWLVVVVDYFSRRVVEVVAFRHHPSTADVLDVLDRATQGKRPRHIVTDRGSQFNADYLRWCGERGIQARFGALGKKGSIALVERFIRSLKTECVRPILTYRDDVLADILRRYVRWFNEHRPHQGLGGMTPNEVVAGAKPVRERLRLEPRARYPDRPGVSARVRDLALDVSGVEAAPRLPVVTLKRAA